jgi:hypothetical protein
MVDTKKTNIVAQQNTKNNNIFATTYQQDQENKPKWYKLSKSDKKSNINVLRTLAFIAIIISPVVISYILFRLAGDSWGAVGFLLFMSWPLFFEMIAIITFGLLVTLLFRKSKYSKRISFLTFLILAIISCSIQVLIFFVSTAVFS